MMTDATTPITTDLLCVGCQYNLRTRSPGDACPECGLPIAQTLSHRKEHAGAVVDARLLRIACYCIAAPSLLCPLFMAGLFVLSRLEKVAPRGAVIAEVLLRDLGQVVFIATLIVGVFLFLNSVGQLIVSTSRRSIVSMLTLTYGTLSIMGVMSTFGLLRRGNPRRIFLGFALMRNQRIGVALICLLLAIEGFVALRKLSRSLAEPKLATWTAWAFGALIADAALSLAIYGVLAIWRLTRDVTQFEGIFAAVDMGSAAIFALFGWYWLRVARTVREVTGKRAVEVESVVVPPVAGSPAEKVGAFLARRKG